MTPGFVTEAPEEAYIDELPFHKLELPQILLFICGLFDVTAKVLAFVALIMLTINVPLAADILTIPDLSPQTLAEGGDILARVQFIFFLGAYSLVTLVMMWPTTILLRIFTKIKVFWPWLNLLLTSAFTVWWIILFFKAKLYIIFRI